MASSADIARFRKKNDIKIDGEAQEETPEVSSMVEALLAQEDDPAPDVLETGPTEIFSASPEDTDDPVVSDTAEADAPPDADAIAPEAVAAEAWTPPTREEYEKAVKAQQSLESQVNLFLQSPTIFMDSYFKAMTPEQQSVFLQGVNQQTEPQKTVAPAKIEGYEEELATPAEREVAKNYEWLRDGRQMTEQFVHGIAREIEQRQAVNLEYVAAVHEQKLSAVLELLGAKLPEIDPAQVQALLNQGKPVREAVQSLYNPGVRKEIERVKKAREIANKPTPKTLGNASSVSQPLPAGATFKEILEQKIGRSLRD